MYRESDIFLLNRIVLIRFFLHSAREDNQLLAVDFHHSVRSLASSETEYAKAAAGMTMPVHLAPYPTPPAPITTPTSNAGTVYN
jgi:hypothetical protein